MLVDSNIVPTALITISNPSFEVFKPLILSRFDSKDFLRSLTELAAFLSASFIASILKPIDSKDLFKVFIWSNCVALNSAIALSNSVFVALPSTFFSNVSMYAFNSVLYSLYKPACFSASKTSKVALSIDFDVKNSKNVFFISFSLNCKYLFS